MAYLSQVDALVTKARGLLTDAVSGADRWPWCGQVLARAFEFAAAAVLLSWGDPRKPGPKAQDPFRDRVVPLLDQRSVAVVLQVWAGEGGGPPVENVGLLLAVCKQAMNYLGDVATSAPPAGWEPPPVPVPVGWEGLSKGEQQFLRDALAQARRWIPQVRMILFGSRAAGEAKSGSDYDLLLIFPDDAQRSLLHQAIGAVTSLGMLVGQEVDVEDIIVSEWDSPSEANVPLITTTRTCGIGVVTGSQQPDEV